VALDLELTPALIQSGLVREIIRAIQEERKNSDFDISDRITIAWNGTEEVIAAIAAQSEFICGEVLATAISHDEALTITDAEAGIALSLRKSL
jgi:isoleucyl-tRNA synthetase